MKVFIVLDAVDLGYAIVSVYSDEKRAKEHVQLLVDNYKYPYMPCEQYIYQECEVI